jgi:hypothetical protein
LQVFGVTDIELLMPVFGFESGDWYSVFTNAFADSSFGFFIYVFAKTIKWVKFQEVKQTAMLEVARIIENNHTEIICPTSTLYIWNNLSVIGQEDAS